MEEEAFRKSEHQQKLQPWPQESEYHTDEEALLEPSFRKITNKNQPASVEQARAQTLPINDTSSQPHQQNAATTMSSDAQNRLRQAFNFFCKCDSILSPKESSTFDKIVHKFEVLTLNKWMMFSRQFGLLSSGSVTVLHDIFKKHSQHNEIDYSAFKNGVIELLNKAPDGLKEGLTKMCLATEESWKTKCHEVGIPYFDKVVPRKTTLKIYPKQKEALKISREKSASGAPKNPPSHPVKTLSKKQQFNLVFQQVNLMKIKLEFPINREDDDDIYLKEYKLTPRADTNSKNASINDRSCHVASKVHSTHQPAAAPFMKRKLSTLMSKHADKGKENNNANLSESGIIKRLDNKINRFKKQ